MLLTASAPLTAHAACPASLAVRWLTEIGRLAQVTIAMALTSLSLVSATLWFRANYLASDAFAEYSPVLQGSLQVSINTDMSVVLAMLTSAFSVCIALALFACGFLHRLLQAGGILREAADAAKAMPSLLLVLPPVTAPNFAPGTARRTHPSLPPFVPPPVARTVSCPHLWAQPRALS